MENFKNEVPETEKVEKTKKDPVLEFLERPMSIIEKEVTINGTDYKAEVSREIFENNFGEMIRKVFSVKDETGNDIKSSDVSPVATLNKETGKWEFDNNSF